MVPDPGPVSARPAHAGAAVRDPTGDPEPSLLPAPRHRRQAQCRRRQRGPGAGGLGDRASSPARRQAEPAHHQREQRRRRREPGPRRRLRPLPHRFLDARALGARDPARSPPGRQPARRLEHGARRAGAGDAIRAERRATGVGRLRKRKGLLPARRSQLRHPRLFRSCVHRAGRVLPGLRGDLGFLPARTLAGNAGKVDGQPAQAG